MTNPSPRLAYFGNQLERHGFSRTGIDYLSTLLAEDFDLVTASHERNQLLRFADMVNVLLKNSDRDIVLIDTYSTRAFHFASLIGTLCRRMKIRYVPILHGGDLASRLERSPKLCKALFGNSFRNVAPSLFLQTVFHDHGFTACVIPNPLHLDDYEFTLRSRVQPKLLYVRAFAQTYNPKLAVRVLKRLLEKFDSATLCMVGPDKDGSRAEVEALAYEMGVHDQIRFTGKLSPRTWRELSREYDIFINTTDVDNAPVSVVEAMALGLPVISTKVGGIPYLVSHGEDGLLVDQNSVDQFTAAVSKLVAEPGLVHRLSVNGRDKAMSFSAENVREHWRRLLNRPANT
jgi:glycosyltransferase involved in cell wall biosynthesis